MHRKRACGGFWGFWKSQWVELSPASEEDGWFSLARGGLGQVSLERRGQMKKPESKECVSLSYVEEPLNSKVIKSFVLGLSRKCFLCFEILCSMYICYEHPIYISHISIWLWYNLIYIFSQIQIFSKIKTIFINKFISKNENGYMGNFYCYLYNMIKSKNVTDKIL